MRAALGRSLQPGARREIEQDRQVRNQVPRRQCIGTTHVLLWQAATGDLIRVSREEEPIGENELASRERRTDHVRDQLRPRCHEEQRFRSLIKVTRRIEQQATNLVTRGRAARLANGTRDESSTLQAATKMLQLSRFPDSFDALEHDQAAGHWLNPA